MKKLFLLAALNILFVFTNAQTSSTIKITGTKFPFEIMQQWIDVYINSHPDVQFQLSKSISIDSADLLIAAHSFLPGELNEDETIASVLCGHSERLAIAWNFVANPNTSRIQITKNLRICGDCRK